MSDALRESINASFRYVSVVAELNALGRSLSHTSADITELVKNEPDLAPEMVVALRHLIGAHEALGRAIEFANARAAVQIDQALDTDEGGN